MGFVASINQNRSLAKITMACLWVLVGIQLLATMKFNDRVQLQVQKMSKNWTSLSPLVKSVIQHSGDCCGYYAIDDRVSGYCPEEATEGCRFHISEVAQGVKNSLKRFLMLDALIALLISIALYVIINFEKLFTE
jgi:hypothetical protein